MARYALHIPRNILVPTVAVVQIEADSIEEAITKAQAQQHWELRWTMERLPAETGKAWAEEILLAQVLAA